MPIVDYYWLYLGERSRFVEAKDTVIEADIINQSESR
jgi:hypothetical protein